MTTEEFKLEKTSPPEESVTGTSVAIITSESSLSNSHQGNINQEVISSGTDSGKGTYLAHLPVKKRKMSVTDSNINVVRNTEQEVVEEFPQVSMVTPTVSPLGQPVSSITASSLLLSALTTVPHSKNSIQSTATTTLWINKESGLLEPSTSSKVANVISYIAESKDGVSSSTQPIKLIVAPLNHESSIGTVENQASITNLSSETKEASHSQCSANANFVATFRCTHCQDELESCEKAQAHRFTHQAESTPAALYVRYHCSPCGASFDTWKGAQEHSADNASVPLVTCNICSSLVPANSMYDHITRHTKQTPEKLSTKLAVQVLKLQKDEENLQLTPAMNKTPNHNNTSSLEHLPLSKKLEIQTALLQADIKRFKVLQTSMRSVHKQPQDPENT